ncbi:MAG: hypothetical protein RIN56_03300 [Sporomusaceae bacterium]|nr:hypothetical protein [Sporomusaceae bacterium]
MIPYRRLAAAIVTLVLILAVHISALAAILVIPEPGADPAHVAIVRKTVDSFNTIVGAEMRVTLNNDVRVFVCPTRDSYRAVLIRELGQKPDVAERSAKSTSGMSGGRSKAVAINFGAYGSEAASARAYKTTAHELFHQLEHQLAGNNMGKSFYWLKEGAADLLGAAVAEKVGYQSLDKWKLDQVNTLRKADKYVSPQAILKTNLAKWTTLIEEKLHPYEMSDLMVFYLMSRTTAGGYRAIGDYYRLLGQGLDNDKAFEQAFGAPADGILAGFQAWFAAISTQSATVEVIASPGIPAQSLDDFNQGVALTRQFMAGAWGGDLISSMRFVLVSGKPAYAAALAKELGLSETEAAQRAKNSTWWNSGGTAIYDITANPAKRLRIHAVSGLLVRRYANDIAPQKLLDQLYWLKLASSEAVAAHIVELGGANTKAAYRQAWLNVLAKAAVIPGLDELTTAAGWEQAKKTRGAPQVQAVVLLAGLYLLDKHGPAAFNEWFKAVAATGSADAAFQKTFGVTVAEFSEEFSNHLRQTLKKAS